MPRRWTTLPPPSSWGCSAGCKSSACFVSAAMPWALRAQARAPQTPPFCVPPYSLTLVCDRSRRAVVCPGPAARRRRGARWHPVSPIRQDGRPGDVRGFEPAQEVPEALREGRGWRAHRSGRVQSRAVRHGALGDASCSRWRRRRRRARRFPPVGGREQRGWLDSRGLPAWAAQRQGSAVPPRNASCTPRELAPGSPS